MMRAPWATHFGFTKLPFSKNVSAKDLLDRASHQEAVARIRFCIAESLLGVITGEVGVGKTVAVRAAISQLDYAAHHVVYVAKPSAELSAAPPSGRVFRRSGRIACATPLRLH